MQYYTIAVCIIQKYTRKFVKSVKSVKAETKNVMPNFYHLFNGLIKCVKKRRKEFFLYFVFCYLTHNWKGEKSHHTLCSKVNILYSTVYQPDLYIKFSRKYDSFGLIIMPKTSRLQFLTNRELEHKFCHVIYHFSIKIVII